MTMRASPDSAPPAFVAPVYAYLASDLARDVTGQILVAAGGFVGSFDRPTRRGLGYRDHHGAGRWPVADVHKMVGAATGAR
jgi:3-oxoacyl-[acyl-carrier protein] reductase